MRVLILILLFSNFVAKAQPIRFNKAIDINGGHEFGFTIIEEDTGYVILAGGWAPAFDNWSASSFIRIDKLGNLKSYNQIGRKQFDYYIGHGGSMKRTIGGDYIYGGGFENSVTKDDQAILVKLSSTGDTVFIKEFGGPAFDAGYDCIEAADGGYFLLGQTYSKGAGGGDIWLVKTDSMGNHQWDTSYGGALREGPNKIIRRSTSFIISGATDSYGKGVTDHWMFQTDSSGKIEWQVLYGTSNDDCGYSTNLTSGNELISRGCIDTVIVPNGYQWPQFIEKRDSQQILIWRLFILNPLAKENYASFDAPLEVTDGNFVLFGDVKDVTGRTKGRLTKVHKNGYVIWDRTFSYAIPQTSNNYLRDMKQTSDGGFIMVGSTSEPSNIEQDVWVVKTDSFGCITPGCQIGDGVEEPVFSDHLFFVYPNPATEQLSVQTELGRLTEAEVLVHDLQGRLVYSYSFKEWSNIQTIDVSSWASGVYVVSLVQEGKVKSSERVVVE